MMRLAMSGLKKAGHFLKSNAGNSAGEIAFRVVPDVGFGVLAATQTPGDFGDKAIAGLTQATGGILGGVGTVGVMRKIPGLRNNVAMQNLGDMAGSVAGDFAGMAVGDNMMRVKDKLMGGYGETPYERMGAEQQAIMAEQLREQIMSQYGLIPGTREQYAIDPTTGMGVA